MSETQTIHLGVDTVIGDGDPISLMPLVCDWHVPPNCLMALQGEDCQAPLAYLYVLREPVNGHKALGICREHDAQLRGPSGPRGGHDA
jgi:hypothetical protein